MVVEAVMSGRISAAADAHHVWSIIGTDSPNCSMAHRDFIGVGPGEVGFPPITRLADLAAGRTAVVRQSSEKGPLIRHSRTQLPGCCLPA